MFVCGPWHNGRAVAIQTRDPWFEICPPNSATILGYSWKVLVTSFISNVAQVLGAFLSYVENWPFSSKICCGYFWTKLGNFLFWHLVTLIAKEKRTRISIEHVLLFCNEINRKYVFFKCANPDLFYRSFSIFSNKHHHDFYNKYMWKNVHLVFGARIRTHNLWSMSLLP